LTAATVAPPRCLRIDIKPNVYGTAAAKTINWSASSVGSAPAGAAISRTTLAGVSSTANPEVRTATLLGFGPRHGLRVQVGSLVALDRDPKPPVVKENAAEVASDEVLK